MGFIKSYDFVCMTETFIDGTFDGDNFPDHVVFESKAIRYSKYGRAQGGVMVLIKKTYSHFIYQIELQRNNLIAFSISPELTGMDKRLIVISCYLPPQESTSYRQS